MGVTFRHVEQIGDSSRAAISRLPFKGMRDVLFVIVHATERGEAVEDEDASDPVFERAAVADSIVWDLEAISITKKKQKRTADWKMLPFSLFCSLFLFFFSLSFSTPCKSFLVNHFCVVPGCHFSVLILLYWTATIVHDS